MLTRRGLLLGLPAVVAGSALAAKVEDRTANAATSQSSTQSSGPIYLTFDDGPHPTWTPQIMRLLDAYNARATFYVLGQWVQHYPWLTRQLADAGHVVANHSLSHANLARLSAQGVAHEIWSTQNLVENAIGRRPTLFRPPFGAANWTVRNQAARAGLSLELWDIDTNDWRLPGARAIADRVTANAYPGAVVLMHDGGGNRRQTVDAVELILWRLSRRGYTFAVMNG